MIPKLNILLLEDSDTDALLLIRFLKKEKLKFEHTRVWNKEGFIKALENKTFDLIIADQNLPQFSGMQAFKIVKEKLKIKIPFILITGSVSEKLLTEYAKDGIDDYLLKDNLLRLPSAIDKILSKKRIETLHHQLKESYEDTRNSINYAKIIQDAILPDESLLHKSFPSSFLFFQPKNILSGDFYWFKKVDEVFYFALADCTGHGIPGAMLSMLGFNILYESVPDKKITKPSEILNNMNLQFRKNLRNGTSQLNDGMDIAFCCINLKTKNLLYAGAKRPLLIERNSKLMEFKADRVSIGGFDRKKKFTDHSVQLLKSDRIFMFSDGYIDQFSEKTDKKITIRRLRKVILQSSKFTIDKQKEYIVNFFEDWKGNKEQLDDVLLSCIQID